MENRKNQKHAMLNNLFERLERGNDITPIQSDLIEIEILENSVLTSDNMRNKLFDLILKLRMNVIDKKNHISSRLVSIDNDQMLWLRIAPNREEITNIEPTKPNNILAYNYLRIFYTYLIAAINIAEIYKFIDLGYLQNINNIQKIITESFLEEVSSANDARLVTILSEGKDFLVNLLSIFKSDLTKEKASKMLDQAKDWVGLEKPNFPIATIIPLGEKFKHHTVVILDEAYCQLLDEQKNLFENIEQQTWFIELNNKLTDDLLQKLVLHYRQNILSGKHVIPSQLRGVIPANKNAFNQTVFVRSENGQLTIINSYNHCGTVAHLSKKDKNTALAITKNNLMQQKHLSNTHASAMICLNSYVGDSVIWLGDYWRGRQSQLDDSEIINLTYNAASQLCEKNIYYAKICLNGFRYAEPNNYGGINKIINHIKQNLDLCLGLNISTNDIKEMHRLIEHINNLEWQFLDYEVKGLAIIFNLTKLVWLNDELLNNYPNENFLSVSLWFGCASGENRTGIACFNNIGSSVIAFLEKIFNVTFDKEMRKKIFKIISDSEHIQIMTAYGGTLGTEGIRSKSINSLNSDHPQTGLVTEVSNTKSIPSRDTNLVNAINRLQLSIKITEDQLPTEKKLLAATTKVYEFMKKQLEKSSFMNENEKNFLLDVIIAVQKILAGSMIKFDVQSFAETTLYNILTELNNAAEPLRKMQTSLLATQSLFAPLPDAVEFIDLIQRENNEENYLSFNKS